VLETPDGALRDVEPGEVEVGHNYIVLAKAGIERQKIAQSPHEKERSTSNTSESAT